MISSKTRLHKFIWLTPELRKNYTRPEIMRNIEKYGVLISEKPSNTRLEWVYPGQNVTTPDWPERAVAPIQDIRVLQETAEYIILFKPFGVPVQPGAGHVDDTVLNWLLAHYPEQKKLMSSSPENSNMRTVAGLVHRIDKNTQGILLVARSAEVHSQIQDEFRQRHVTKKYLAVVTGIITESHDLQGWQCRDKTNPMKQRFFENELEAKNYDMEARYVHSIITPKKVCPELSQTLIEVEIKTGRMHQIRVACEYLGFPLVAEHLYNKSPVTAKNATSKIQDLSTADFVALKSTIFGNVEFCLLANEISISKEKISLTYFDLNSY